MELDDETDYKVIFNERKGYLLSWNAFVLEYVHNGYGSVYEKELFLRFLNGKLIGEREKDNRKEYEKKLAREKRFEQEKENRKIVNRIRRLFSTP